MTESLNHALFLFINAGSDTPPGMISLAAFVAQRVIYLLPPMLAAMWLWGNTDYRNTVLKALLVTSVALSCNVLIGIYVHTQRPFELGIGHTFLAHAATASFPSNHLTIFLGVGLSALRGAAPRMGIVILAAGTVVAWARVFVGVHFPLDMAGAVLVCGAVYCLVTPVWNRYGHTVTIQFERVYRLVFALPISAGWLRD